MLQLKIFLFLNTLLFCYGDNYGLYYRESDDAYIERPCEVFDKFCIRTFFKEHSSCKEKDRAVPDPLYRDQTVAHFSHANITFIPNNINITGLNGVIEEFYINKKTNNLVLAVEFRNLNASSPTVFGIFYRSGQEPIVELDYASMAWKSLVTTIIIPNLKDLQLDKSEVFSYSNDEVPQLTLGPRLIKPGFDVDPHIAVREILLADTQFYIGSYIQYNICDFGLKLH